MKQSLRVLIAEDNPADAELVVRELGRAGFEPKWERVDTEADYVARLRPNLDIILSDDHMPNFGGLRALELLKERGLDIPFIIVSGTIGEEVAVEAMKRGAADYLLKDRLTRLGAAVTRAMDEWCLRKVAEQAEESMRQSEHKYRHLFENLGEAAFLIERASRRIVEVNYRAGNLVGRSRTEILGMDYGKLFPSAEVAADFERLSGAAAQTDRQALGEAVVARKEGEVVPVQFSIAPIELYGRHLVLVLMTDITERKRAEAALREAMEAAEEGSRVKSEFIATMSHEIRTPLNGVIGTLDLLLDDEPSGERRGWLAEAKRSALSLLTLLSELLTFSSMDAGKAQRSDSPFSLDECIALSLEPLAPAAAAKGLALSRFLAPEIPPILLGDERRLGQIISNLVGNAIKFTDRGEVSLRVTVESLSAHEASLLFVVRDDGIGIPGEHLETIFHPFVQVDSSSTRAYGGVGLGLAIVQRSLDVLGGRIEVKSEPRKGSVFSFILTFSIDAL